MQKRIAMIGGGNMATALVAGLIADGVDPASVDVLDRNVDKCERLHKLYGVNVHECAGDWLSQADVIVLAVKPQGLAKTIKEIKHLFRKDALFISIAAGVRVADISRWLGSNKVVRAMPNTPAQVNAGVVGWYAPLTLSDDEKALARKVIQAMGEVITVSTEEQIDWVSTVSGSGPAYVFRFIEAMEAAVVRRGFDPSEARRMAIMTVVGAGKLASLSSDSPAQLRENVTSKGGTTAEALRVMQEHDFMGMMDEAIQAAFNRSQQLADELGKD